LSSGSRRLDAARAELGASAVTLDLSDAPGLSRFFAELSAPVDHVVVTGGGPVYAPIATLDFDAARAMLDEHLLGALRVARECAGRVRPGGSSSRPTWPRWW
jgi:NAD(P)-dependent dehydrogenase (short-subunit alcohol dehydrogenase family)